MNPLYEIVQDVQRFFKATNEMVIMDFHRFPHGFDNSDAHAGLLRYLRAELGDYMTPDWLGRSVTPNDLWNMNRTLIVTYSHDPSSAFSDVLWSEVRQIWGNQQSGTGLKNFLGQSMNLRRWARYPWAAMTHLTPTKIGIFFSPSDGMREMSDEIARNVSKTRLIFHSLNREKKLLIRPNCLRLFCNNLQNKNLHFLTILDYKMVPRRLVECCQYCCHRLFYGQ
jgi:hypothetical protein